jgi:hypothetical protein
MKTILAAIALAAGWAVAEAAPPVKGGAIAAIQAEATAKVEKVDQDGKTVTIKDPAGNTVKIEVPPDVQSLKGIKPGMLLDIRYLQATALAFAKPGVRPGFQEETVTLVPKDGSGQAVVNTKEITGMVQDLDRSKRTVTVKGPDGRTHMLAVPEDVEGFDQVKTGDTVVLRYSEAVALAASKQDRGAK